MGGAEIGMGQWVMLNQQGREDIGLSESRWAKI